MPEPSAELWAAYAERARAVTARLSCGEDLTAWPAVGSGECGQCGKTVAVRRRYGAFDLCLTCLASRRRHARPLPEVLAERAGHFDGHR